eukprot:CAMPEP_0184310258 /NCGR_PEP_ID=MMETSP1049-20130417/26737_1 /TAXON_ID=77928 /ORGANISM="Proteomonas sulcata, Strain CCMP704" /LENGTH=31 /DNA_ID= /DNA_START= /DNA_END= /DNA_ORIENTATION=
MARGAEEELTSLRGLTTCGFGAQVAGGKPSA